jgi:hypothetical protein
MTVVRPPSLSSWFLFLIVLAGLIGSAAGDVLVLADGLHVNWGGSAELASAFAAAGSFALPAGSLDAALSASLAPGNYTPWS